MAGAIRITYEIPVHSTRGVALDERIRELRSATVYLARKMEAMLDEEFEVHVSRRQPVRVTIDKAAAE